MTQQDPSSAPSAPSDFIRDIVAGHVAERRYPRIVTRFPPEPNGYLHIGHAKSICLNFGIARENGGSCNLRMDDTNPAKEDVEYVDAIVNDVRWLIAGWADHCLRFKPRGAVPAAGADAFQAPAEGTGPDTEPFYASDYFDALHGYAVALIRAGKAYVCDLSAKETDEYRGAPDKPGRDSPYRNRSVEENLNLFARMRAGEFPDGARTLRAKIDMAAPNVWLRDPVLYRIRHASHHHTGDAWCIYPLYDFAHGLSDYIEGVTHSICTLEFEVHRPLYDWLLENLSLPRPLPHQYEFAKFIPSFTVVSKRKLLVLVQEGIVSGWDDPRMPTISGLRRRGIPARAIRHFVTSLGVTKFNSVTDIAAFEHAVREDLNATAPRRLAVLRPIKVVLTNLAADAAVTCAAVNLPADTNAGTRAVALTREIFIESDDFMETPPPKYFRLRPGGEVRLKYGCIIACQEVVKDGSGRITELRCTADLSTRSGEPNAARKVKGTIHWVSARDARDAEVRLYDRLFTVAEPDADGADFRQSVNPRSLEVVTAKVEPALFHAEPGETCQFERLGYFAWDPDSKPGAPIFNRTIGLKDAWAK
ncbi:MAG TPA: glutamine--tRNA ligase [Opitutaceae bacterium]|jgi:glutaminyl-tRNA synthetase|nr:glutamine--tRNA ligase [Opitutaceae bacterium]